jgi:hypothetical protein
MPMVVSPPPPMSPISEEFRDLSDLSAEDNMIADEESVSKRAKKDSNP